MGGVDQGDGSFVSPWFGQYDPQEGSDWIRHFGQRWYFFYQDIDTEYVYDYASGWWFRLLP